MIPGPAPWATRLFRELQAGAAHGARESGLGGRTGLRSRPPAPEPRPPDPIALARLPRPLTSLIGREQVLQEVTRLVTTSRLVTLVGGGGVGKTRLALQVAAGLEEQYPERTLFIELASLADLALLATFVEIGRAHV